MTKPPNAGRIYLMIGLPGSGKSTWARQNAARAVVVSADDIRIELFGSLIRANKEDCRAANNEVVFSIFHYRIIEALQKGKDVIADETALQAFSRAHIRNIADFFGSELHYVLFTNVDEALKYNASRDPDKKVPDRVMKIMKGILYSHTLEEVQLERYTDMTVVKHHG